MDASGTDKLPNQESQEDRHDSPFGMKTGELGLKYSDFVRLGFVD